MGVPARVGGANGNGEQVPSLQGTVRQYGVFLNTAEWSCEASTDYWPALTPRRPRDPGDAGRTCT
jgi:hypothetical protein